MIACERIVENDISRLFETIELVLFTSRHVKMVGKEQFEPEKSEYRFY